jgi:hypothetical protein
MSTLSQLAWIGFLVAGFLCFAYSWFAILRIWSDKTFRWRDRISLLALILASVAVLLRFVMPIFWGSDFGDQVRIAVAWTRVSVGMCALALVLGLVGRPRLIVPLVVACLATAGFWMMSTIP